MFCERGAVTELGTGCSQKLSLRGWYLSQDLKNERAGHKKRRMLGCQVKMWMPWVWKDLIGLEEPKRPGWLKPGNPGGREIQLQRSQNWEETLERQLDFMMQTVGSPGKFLSRGVTESQLYSNWALYKIKAAKKTRLDVRKPPCIVIALHAQKSTRGNRKGILKQHHMTWSPMAMGGQEMEGIGDLQPGCLGGWWVDGQQQQETAGWEGVGRKMKNLHVGLLNHSSCLPFRDHSLSLSKHMAPSFPLNWLTQGNTEHFNIQSNGIKWE